MTVKDMQMTWASYGCPAKVVTNRQNNDMDKPNTVNFSCRRILTKFQIVMSHKRRTDYAA